jgi:hypothetical protein
MTILYPNSNFGHNNLKQLSLAHQTMFADLIQKCLDAEFDEAFAENGSFTQVKGANGQLFWYYKGYDRLGDAGNKRYAKYVGPVADAGVTARVAQFKRVKAGYQERRSLVTSLTAAGMPSPPSLAGGIVEVLWKAGLFRLHGVLVGTVAFQCYAGLLGALLPQATLMTGDIDLAQFHSISVSVADSMLPMLDVLRQADATFREAPNLAGPHVTTGYINAKGFKVEFLTPNRGKDEYAEQPAPMPALGGAAAQPLRYLDFLIHRPVRSVLLHKGGVAVLVPAPERYAIHKLIVAAVRREDRDGAIKAGKDLMQAGALIEALAGGAGRIDLGLAWEEAIARGDKWRENLELGAARLPEAARAKLTEAAMAARKATGLRA